MNSKTLNPKPQTRLLFQSTILIVTFTILLSASQAWVLANIEVTSPKAISTAPVSLDTSTTRYSELQQSSLESFNRNPFLNIVPNTDGTEIIFSTEGPQRLNGEVFAHTVGPHEANPTGSMGSWTMPYSTTTQSHIKILPFLSNQSAHIGRVNITSTAGLDTDEVVYQRIFVPNQPPEPLDSVDTFFQVDLINPGTIGNIAAVVATNVAQPGPIPHGHALIGNSYSVRVGGSIISTTLPMALQMSYAETLPSQVSPHTLDIFFWHPSQARWIPQNASFSLDKDLLLTNIKFFGTYAILSKPEWVSDLTFVDNPANEIIETAENIVRRGPTDATFLRLSERPGVGHAVTIPITPVFGLENWDTLYFSSTEPLSTALSIDLLDINQELLIADVQSGQSITSIITDDYPSLRVRVNMTSTADSTSPQLHGWKVTWQPPRPVTIQAGSGSVELGNVITVPIQLVDSPPVGLGAATIELLYEPTYLEVTGCNVVGDGSGSTFCNIEPTVPEGERNQVRFNLIASTPLTQATTLAEVTFHVVGWTADGATLELSPVLVTEHSGQLLPIQVQNGIISMTTQPTGDVNCDERVDGDDVSLIRLYDVGLAEDATSCPPGDGQIFFPECDITVDSLCDLRDALELSE